MKKGQTSPEQSTDGDIEFEGGTTAGGNDGDKLFNDFRNDVKRKIAEYQSSKGQDDESEFNTTEEIDTGVLFMRQSDCCDKVLMFFATLCSIVFGAGMPAFSFLFGEMVNGLGETTAGNYDTFKQSALAMFIVGIVMWFMSWAQVSLWASFAQRTSYKIRMAYFAKTLELDAAFYDENNPNEMSAKIAKEIMAIQRGLGEKVGNTIMSVSMTLIGFVFAFYIGWRFTLILLGVIPLALIAGVGMTLALTTGVTQMMRAYAQSAGYAEQALNAIRVVHSYGQEDLEVENYKKFLLRASKVQRDSSISTSSGLSVLYLIIFGFYAYSFWFGGMFRWSEDEFFEKNSFTNKRYTGGDVIGIMFMLIMGVMQLGAIGPNVKALTEGKIGAKLAYDVIDFQQKVRPGRGEQLTGTITGQIDFKDVAFTYPTRPDLKVLKSLTCSFDAGKTTAIVGPSGSGKSTIIQLIERFYQPNGGQVLLDGNDVAKVDVRSMRNYMGYVGQEPILFNATIKENMLFSKRDATDEEIVQALKDANAWSFITNKMKKGIHTEVGGAGGSLSGGQKQRVAVARAFLRKPKILLLDEATSALDKMNEKLIQEAIDAYRHKVNGMSVIVIAHRLTTIQDADKIIVLKDGVLTEQGNHQELLTNYPEGTYAEFVAKQKSAEEEVEEGDAHEDDAEPIVEAEKQASEIKPERRASILKAKKSLRMDPKEEQMFKTCDERDEILEKQIKEMNEENAKKGFFGRLMAWNDTTFIVLAVIFSLFVGASQPVFGGFIFSKVMTQLTVEPEVFDFLYPGIELKDEMAKYSLIMVGFAIGTFLCMFFQKLMFNRLSEQVTYHMRYTLYNAIISKSIGWFDLKENSVGVLSSSMATDTTLVNGVSSESLGPQFESGFAMLTGMGIGFYYCWQMSVVMIVTCPFMIIGQAIAIHFQSGLTDKSNDLTKEADLLAGDSISNFKTVQSFANEDMIVKRYRDLMAPVNALTMKTNVKIGFGFGVSNFFQFGVFAVMFYAAGVLLEAYWSLNVQDVMSSLFAIMFSAMQAGNAAAFGPDMGKAKVASERVFGIIDYPSNIDARATTVKGIKVNKETFVGKIEFKDVWFRYPRRKEDFVLRGLNLTINPNESVALVGESGCGKSTFVNLVMRFYDVDSGDVFIDGVNIKDYDLHSLRNVISMVMQEPIIFNYNILENCLYGKTDATNSEVLECCELSNCMEFIDNHAGNKEEMAFDDSAQALLKEMADNRDKVIALIGQDKYDEEVKLLHELEKDEQKKGGFQSVAGSIDRRGDHLRDVQLSVGFESVCGIRGGKLSGGQKQRVAIARTIIRKPTILILDEATSALDETSQKKVQGALSNAMKGRTTIIIAHRMSTIEGCDKIFVLENGVVKEQGGFSELKAQGGLFSKISAKK